MTHNYVAFTIKSNNGVFSEIKIPMQVLTSDMECKARNIKAKVAPVIALWDTGATMSGITKELARELGLEPFSMTSISTAGGLVSDVPVYRINFILSSNTNAEFPAGVVFEIENDVKFFNVHITELPDNIGFDFLVGMDIITQGDFSITNKDRNSCISFRIPPDPLFHIDYVACSKSDKKGKLSKGHLRHKQRR